MVPGRQQDQEGPLVLDFSLGCCCGTGSVGANRTCCKRACILLESATGEKDRPLERLWHVRHAVAMQKRTPVGLQATDATGTNLLRLQHCFLVPRVQQHTLWQAIDTLL